MAAKMYAVVLLVVGLAALKVDALCPYECQCGNEPKSCGVGVSLVTDGCKCCLMCARQQDDWCDNENVCDTHRGLVCDYTDSINGERGVCKAQNGRSCFYKGRSYLNGEMFRPSCKHQCWCMDKEVGCLSLCPHETVVPKTEVCPGARLEEVPGKCCKVWVCAGLENSPQIDMDKFWDELVDDATDDDMSTIQSNDLTAINPGPSSATYFENAQDKRIGSHRNNIVHDPNARYHAMGDGGPGGDDLLDYQIAFASHRRKIERGLGFLEDSNEEEDYDEDAFWEDTNEVAGDEDARRRRQKIKEGCKVQTSQWSDCSKSCGLGVSTRVSNRNSKCQVRRDIRLCQVRLCDQKTTQASPSKRGRKTCARHKRPKRRQYFEYAGCRSTKSYKPRYCGKCEGHTCFPQSTRTVKVKFRCEGRTSFSKKMMMVRSCRCSAVTLSFHSFPNLHNDTFDTAMPPPV